MKFLLFTIIFVFQVFFSFSQQITYPCEYYPDMVLKMNGTKYQFYSIKINEEVGPEFEVSECEYPLAIDADFCYLPSEEEIAIKVDEKWGVYSLSENKMIIPAVYDRIKKYYGSDDCPVFFSLQKGKKTYIFNHQKDLAEMQGGDIFGFWNDHAIVRQGNKCAFYDINGKLNDDFNPGDVSYHFLIFQLDCQYGVISDKGNIILEPVYQSVSIFSYGFTAQKDSLFALIDFNGKSLTAFKYAEIDAYDYCPDSIIGFSNNGKHGLLRTNGEEISPAEYDYIFNTEGPNPAQKDGLYGFLDDNGKLFIPCIYEKAAAFSEEGLAYVKKDGKYGFIDLTGKIAIPLIYDVVDYFRGGKAKVELSGRSFCIDVNGNEIK